MKRSPTALAIAMVGILAGNLGGPPQIRAAEDKASSTSSPKQGAELLKVDILGVFAHPDDETGLAPVTAFYALARQKTVAHVYCTRGEGGGNMVGTQLGPALGMLREAELRDCLNHLGVRYCYFLDQLDWAYTESLAATLRKWGKEETLGRLVRVVRTLRPDVIVTMNPAPTAGQHGHHQAAGVLAIEAFMAAGDAKRFPEQLHQEGLSPWQVRKIYVGGGGTNASASIVVSDALPDGRTPGQVAAEALANHRSQAFGSFAGSPWLSRPQTFTLVKSVLPARPASAPIESDLLQDLPSPTTKVDRPSIRPNAAETELRQRPSLSFRPRPAVSQYLRWVHDYGLESLSSAARFRADVPLIAGEANEVTVEFNHRGLNDISGAVRLIVPDGWNVTPTERKVVRPPAGAPSLMVFQVTPPTGRPPDGEMRAELISNGNPLSASGLGHPVPRTKVPRIRTAPRLDGHDPIWASLPGWPIRPTDLVQGKVTNAADSSATFRLAHDGQRLYVDVDVADDQVVSNIAPNDIKGHWRSDSVEICFDPVGGVEDTMGCYKLGIFPFDSTGVVRAARDADARQGPVEETAPGTRLFSTKTPGGYRIQVSIPFTELGWRPKRGARPGFNVIIYDGDKTNAAPGENINKSRIAWLPRSGVQGRPEDWGRLEFE